jgi:cullin 1
MCCTAVLCHCVHTLLPPLLLLQVLTTGYWPTYKPLDVVMPAEMVACTQIFREYYDDKHNKRRLQWIHSLGNVTVKSRYPKNKIYDLQITTLQVQ